MSIGKALHTTEFKGFDSSSPREGKRFRGEAKEADAKHPHLDPACISSLRYYSQNVAIEVYQ